jgi:hypothetical protein
VSCGINVIVFDIEVAIAEFAVIVTTIGMFVSPIYLISPLSSSKIQLMFFPIPSALSVTIFPEVQDAIKYAFEPNVISS